MGYETVYETVVKTDNLNDRELKKYGKRCLENMKDAVSHGPMVEDILLKYGPTAYKVEVTLKVFAWKETEKDGGA